MSPEESLLSINLLHITFAYLWLFARLGAFDMQKVMLYDTGVVVVAVAVAAYFFYGSDIIFHFLGLEVDWLVFTVLSYFILEVPFALWYFNKYDLWGR